METKECSKCGHDLPLDKFYNDSKSSDGKQAQCNDCKRDRKSRKTKGKSKASSAKREKKKAVKKAKRKPESKSKGKKKECSRCERELPLDMFYNDSKSKDGKQAQCNDCKRIRKKRPSAKSSQNGVVIASDKSKKENPIEQPVRLIKYSNQELAEFKEIILKKINLAEESIRALKASISGSDSNGTDDTASSTKGIEDGSDVVAKEEAMALASRQQKFVSSLKDALSRIDQGTYGICCVTGRLIPKERLVVVPHATACVESKEQKEKISTFVPETASEESESD